jgi:Domain of Unknown Function (DUF1206)
MKTSLGNFGWIARIGYAGRAALFLWTGGLGLYTAWRTGRGKTQGVLETILAQPLGDVMLAVLAIGLICFAAWRILQAFWDVDRIGRNREALGKRVVYALSAVSYALMAFWTLNLSLISRSDSPSEVMLARKWTAWLLSVPFGSWILAGIGLGFVAIAIGVGVRAWRAPLDPELTVKRTARNWLVPFTRYALLARATVFALIGGSLIAAAIRVDAGATKGMGGTLQALQLQPYGSVLLTLIALGFIVYGVYECAQATWHRTKSR